jgi:hypothetical protein
MFTDVPKQMKRVSQVVPVHTMKAFGGVEEQTHTLLTLALDGGKLST